MHCKDGFCTVEVFEKISCSRKLFVVHDEVAVPH